MDDVVVPTAAALAAYTAAKQAGTSEAECRQAAFFASPYESALDSDLDARVCAFVYESTVARERAERAWVALWNALDNAETYIATTARDSLLHQTVYGALTAHNPGADLFSRYDRHADEEEAQ